MDELKIVMGKDGVFREYKEPYCVIECHEKEDYDHIVEMVECGEKMRWIPAAVKLPEEDKCEYLVLVNGEYTNDEYANGPYATQRFERAVEIALYTEEEGWILEAYPDWDDPVITHWMPLPEPPEVDHDQN